MSIDEAIRLNFSLLDKIDFQPYISNATTIYDIRQAVQGAYEDHEFSPEIEAVIEGDTLQGYVFNWIDDEDLITYLRDNYNMEFREETTYWVVR